MKKNVVIRSGYLSMGGIAKVLVDVLQNLDKNKYRIFLFIEKDFGKDNIFLKDIPVEIKVYFLKSEKLIEKAKYYRSKKKNIFYKIRYNIQMHLERKIEIENLKKYLNEIEEEYGLVETFIDYDCGTNKYIEKINVKRKVAWAHISYAQLLKKKNKIIRFGIKLKKYDVIVNICEEMKNEMLAIYPFLKEKLKVCYNSFDFKKILELSENFDEIKNKGEKYYELLKDNYIIAVSRLALEQKDYKTLIQGYKLYIKNGGKYKLYIVGDGPDKNKIYDMIEKEGLEKNIILLGQMKNPYIWMKNAKLFIHSSFYEGFGLVLVEAMICGKVVLSFDCPVGPTEILSKGNCGVLFKTGDKKDLAEKLLKLTNEELFLYQEKIKSRIEEFKMENVIKEYEKLIGE